MMNAKLSLKHDNLHHIRKFYALESIYDDENECMNDTSSTPYLLETWCSFAPDKLATPPIDWVKSILNKLIYMLV